MPLDLSLIQFRTRQSHSPGYLFLDHFLLIRGKRLRKVADCPFDFALLTGGYDSQSGCPAFIPPFDHLSYGLDPERH